ncbi:MAG: DUF1731 domain-containing protein [Sphingobacteriales bacterium]|nr:DUF1731 domain-containing protein [Sphingobacteriales bacterium]
MLVCCLSRVSQCGTQVLKSATVSCKKIQDAGFTFLYPSIDAALDDLCRR